MNECVMVTDERGQNLFYPPLVCWMTQVIWQCIKDTSLTSHQELIAAEVDLLIGK